MVKGFVTITLKNQLPISLLIRHSGMSITDRQKCPNTATSLLGLIRSRLCSKNRTQGDTLHKRRFTSIFINRESAPYTNEKWG